MRSWNSVRFSNNMITMTDKYVQPVEIHGILFVYELCIYGLALMSSYGHKIHISCRKKKLGSSIGWEV